MNRKHIAFFLTLLFYFSSLSWAGEVRTLGKRSTANAFATGDVRFADNCITSAGGVQICGYTAADIPRDGSTTFSVEDSLAAWVDVRSYMDGVSGRPTLAQWQADNTINVAASVQAAYNALQAAGNGGHLKFPKGRFKISSVSVNNPVGITTEGAGSYGGTEIEKFGTDNTAIFTFTGTAGTVLESHMTMKHLSIAGNDNCNGIDLVKIARSTIDDVYVSKSSKALYLNGSLVIYINNSSFVTSVYGIYARSYNFTSATVPNKIVVEHSNILSNTTAGIDYDDGTMLVVTNCDIESNGTTGNANTGGVLIGNNLGCLSGCDSPGSYVADITIDKSWFENNEGWQVKKKALPTPTNRANGKITIKDSVFLFSDLGDIWIYGIFYSNIEDISYQYSTLIQGVTYSKRSNVYGSSVVDNADYTTVTPEPHATTPTFDNTNFYGSGSMTWSVEAADVTAYHYVVTGQKMVLTFKLYNTTVSGTPDPGLLIKIPGGYSALNAVEVPIYALDNNVSAVAFARVAAGGTVVQLIKHDTSNWTASSGDTRVAGQLTLDINK